MSDTLSEIILRRAAEQLAGMDLRDHRHCRDSWAIAGEDRRPSKPKPAPCGVHGCTEPRGFYKPDIAMHLCKHHINRYNRGLPLSMDDKWLYGPTQSRDMERQRRGK